MAKKLYELLAIEGQLKDQVAKTRADLRATFEKKRHLFEQKLKTFTPNVEGATGTVEEESSIQSTAASELRWIAGIWAGAMDSSFQIAHGNTKANADVELDDGTTLLRDVPATALLELEKRAGELLDLIAAVPTLDPAKGFDLDPSREGGIYRARDVRKTRTHKVQEALVLLQPTAEHPGQAQMITVDKPIGTILEQEWSGLITPATKAGLLERVERLRRAFKAALQRANAVELGDARPRCGQAIFDYVFAADGFYRGAK
jgi:hypothetical protein